MNAFLIGIIFGLTIAVSIGPGFLALFQTSLLKGINAGFRFAAGMWLGDLILVSISYFGFSQVLIKGDNKLLGIIAGCILIIMGMISLVKKKVSIHDSKAKIDLQNNFLIIFFKGFLLNMTNPFSLVFWIGIVGFAGKNWGMHSQNIFLFLAGVFFTAFSTDLIKCYLSGLLRKVLASNAIHWMNRAMGIVFVGIGIFIICKVH